MSTTLFLVCLVLFHAAAANIIQCNETHPCGWSDITCNPKEDCSISCIGAQSCIESNMHCPAAGGCNIQCQGGQSCRNAVINATYSSGNFDLQCLNSTDHCRNIQIHGSILDTNTGDFNVRCSGKLRSCINSEIHCPLNGDCNVECASDSSCRWAQITGPIHGDLTVDCRGVKSCFDGIFDASNSWSMEVAGCMQDESCLDLTLYCPPHSNGSANCHIQGDDNLGKDNAGGTQIYAVNGWKDVVMEYYGRFAESRHEGTMYCGENYNHSCSLAADQWLCSDPDDYCNNVDATLNPTQQPTTQPTTNPVFVLTLLSKNEDTTTTQRVSQRDNNVSHAKPAANSQTNYAIHSLDKSQLLVFLAVITGIMALCISCVACNKFKNYIDYHSRMPAKQDSADSVSSSKQKEFDMAITTMINISDSSSSKLPLRHNEPGSPRYVDNESSLNSAEIQTEGKSLMTTNNNIAPNIMCTNEESIDNTFLSEHLYAVRHSYADRPSLVEPSNSELREPKTYRTRYSADLGPAPRSTVTTDLSTISTSNTVPTSLLDNGWPVTSGSIHEIYITPQPPQRQSLQKHTLSDKLNKDLSPLQSRRSDNDVVEIVNDLQTADSVPPADSVQPPPSDKSDSVEQNADEEMGGSDSELYQQGPKESITPTETGGLLP